jgi:hypothetical protein
MMSVSSQDRDAADVNMPNLARKIQYKYDILGFQGGENSVCDLPRHDTV